MYGLSSDITEKAHQPAMPVAAGQPAALSEPCLMSSGGGLCCPAMSLLRGGLWMPAQLPLFRVAVV
jgi:hypothetical protein